MGQNISKVSSKVLSMPPTACLSSGVPSGASLANRLLPSLSAMLTCMCMPVPARSSKGLAMKHAAMPCLCATPLTRRL
ncbi:hypothetical protein D3C76_1706910 [compost metagenome]